MKVATSVEMRQIDALVMEDYGIPGAVLMESAGIEAASAVETLLARSGGKRVCVFSGKGNNGGDGFVVARRLANHGYKVQVCLTADISSLSGEALIYFTVLQKMGLDILEIAGERDWDKAGVAVSFADCLVDALLGTGLHGIPSERMVAAIDLMNSSGKPIIAVDIPSGVEADTGCVTRTAVKAAKTVTFGLPKPGLYLHPGAAYAGEVTVVDIGIPADLLQSRAIKQNTVTAEDVRSLLPLRAPDAHKGSCGRVGVIAGSQGMTGAAVLASTGALRSGAGLVTLGIAASLNPVLEVKLTEVMTCPWPENADGALGAKSVPYMDELAMQSDVTLIGPGLGRREETQTAIRQFIKEARRPLVIDADALTALSVDINILQQTEALAVLTPHPGEMAMLTGLTVEEISQDRLYVARQAAIDWASIVVLKGAGTVVAFPDGEVYLNSTGNPGMATGGTGDVLAGIIASFIAQGLSSHDAAVAGVYVHGLAGDIAADRGMIGMTAGDLAEAIPAAIHSLTKKA
ncbi:bifunctional ADP-dependent (S)-NAD(P)H-hydrate dehydratase/NAD(P)H-hydrate epimerase [Anaerosporomusa subterranea]|uniref:Bifunctional NAD(P)H-hydrate repair enzyme n=1 Tax=Anaerosporomusa subterranea TaxID=1794912 RepID=A0A154BMX6_ANASB|nr:bifunctional ADP-dependent NAD(P)H-hydrate dehydratase/NAD(P)H-hydrate epimerase [Anaerosporomusa subterranea]KYZ75235.1 bifunctional ADP-dependent (S)-NAD(P)H-hydrate dehydratase/NAD(P)H-hydrate epimerase [Anaerosporomusa subterranea]